MVFRPAPSLLPRALLLSGSCSPSSAGVKPHARRGEPVSHVSDDLRRRLLRRGRESLESCEASSSDSVRRSCPEVHGGSMRVLIATVGALLVGLMLSEFFMTFMLPRRVRRDPRIARGLDWLLWRRWRALRGTWSRPAQTPFSVLWAAGAPRAACRLGARLDDRLWPDRMGCGRRVLLDAVHAGGVFGVLPSGDSGVAAGDAGGLTARGCRSPATGWRTRELATPGARPLGVGGVGGGADGDAPDVPPARLLSLAAREPELARGLTAIVDVAALIKAAVPDENGDAADSTPGESCLPLCSARGRLFLVVCSFVTDRVIRRRPIRVIGAGSRIPRLFQRPAVHIVRGHARLDRGSLRVNAGVMSARSVCA